MVKDECVVDDVNSAGVDAAVQSRLERRLWEIHSAGVDSAVQSRLGLRLWEITSAVVDDTDGCAGGDDSFRKKMILDRRFGQATRT